MGQFFGSIYCFLFEDFFGLDLADYLWGISSPEQTTNMFILIGLTMLAVTAVLAATYYYILDHPRLANWWGWSIFMVVDGVINFFVGWSWVLQHYYAEKMVTVDVETGEKVSLPIDGDNIFCFGVTNFIIAILAFCIISACIKWWSTNSRQAPF